MNGAARQPEFPVSMPGLPGSRMLIVDDEHHITAALRDYFTVLGYLVDVAESEGAARSLLDRLDYAAVITDLRLSERRHSEGMDIVEHARRSQPKAACIILTSYGDAASENEARRIGADAFLHKPTPLHLLAERLAEILKDRYQNS
jgi:DNA-binding response OmpR family regulator